MAHGWARRLSLKLESISLFFPRLARASLVAPVNNRFATLVFLDLIA